MVSGAAERRLFIELELVDLTSEFIEHALTKQSNESRLYMNVNTSHQLSISSQDFCWHQIPTDCIPVLDTHLTVSFSRTTWVSRHQNSQTILDFNEARDDGVALASAGPYANYLHLTPDM